MVGQQNNSSTSIREYDCNGYHVVEMDAPNYNFMIKYNENYMQIINNKEKIYDGTANDNLKKDIINQLHLIESGLTNIEFDSDLDSQEWLYCEMQELNLLIKDVYKPLPVAEVVLVGSIFGFVICVLGKLLKSILF